MPRHLRAVQTPPAIAAVADRRTDGSPDPREAPATAAPPESTDALLMCDEHGRIEQATPMAATLLGRRVHDLTGRKLDELLGSAADRLSEAMPGQPRSVDWRPAPDRAVELTARPFVVSGRAGLVCTVRDVTASRRAQDRLVRRHLFDDVTGLPKRALLVDRLTQRTDVATTTVAHVLVADLDRINRAFGHHVGDQVLTEIAQRLSALIGPDELLSRVGASEFVLLTHDSVDLRTITTTARAFVASLRAPIVVAGERIPVRASAGIAIADQAPFSPADLLREAAWAARAARSRGDSVASSTDVGANDERHDLVLERDLRDALGQEAIEFELQPVVRAGDRQVVGAEALARWTRDGERVSPGAFIPVAESTGLIGELDTMVLRRACEFAANHLPSSLWVSVNVSAHHLYHRDLVADVHRALDDSGLPGHRLCLEVTESLVVDNFPEAVAVLSAVRELGVRIAMDDFGAGYSSLGSLKSLPLDVLKIDRGLVDTLEDGGADASILDAVVRLGRALGLTVLVEGVERAGQLEVVRDLGCDLVQGFLTGRPSAPDDLAAAAGQPAGCFGPAA